MSVSGVCQICESRTARHSCRLCGRVVCEEHYRPEENACTACAVQSDAGSGGRTE